MSNDILPSKEQLAADRYAAKVASMIIQKTIRAAGKRLPFKSEKQQNEMLEFAAGSLAEAYRIGAEEAQGEIINRLRALQSAVSGKQP